MPEDPVDLRKWVFGIARRKVADHIARLPRRHLPTRENDGIELPLGEVDAIDLVRWARSEVGGNPEDVRTLGWMVREGLFGDKLASIAVETGLPAARVRQRVSRLRRTLRQRWAAQVGGAIAVVVLAMAWWSSGLRSRSDSRNPMTVCCSRLRRTGPRACDNGLKLLAATRTGLHASRISTRPRRSILTVNAASVWCNCATCSSARSFRLDRRRAGMLHHRRTCSGT